MRASAIGIFVGVAALSTTVTAQQPAAAGMTLEISYSPRAAAEMRRLGEGLMVAAYYHGEARPAYRRRAADDGEILLGDEQIAVPNGARRVVITGRNFLAARLSWVTEPTVDVNLFSARRRSRDNLLNCTVVSGTLAEVAGRTHAVRCALIGE